MRRRIILGTYALSAGYYDAYYGKALEVRRLIADDFDRAYQHADVLLTPTAPSVAFPFGAKADPLAMYLNDVYTIPSNLAGHTVRSAQAIAEAWSCHVRPQVLAGAAGAVDDRVAAALEAAAKAGRGPPPSLR